MTSSPDRRGYLDWLRGIGVLIMIEAHTVDAWTRLADRDRPAYQWALVVGGFGAPIFLFLAGVAMALAAGSRSRRGLSEDEIARRARRRGWQVLGLAFLFRLQSLVISGGGLRAFLKVDILNIMGITMLAAAGLWQIGRTARGRALALAAAAVTTAMLTPPVRSAAWLDPLPDAIEAYIRPETGRSTFTLFPWGGFLFAGVVAGLWLDGSRPSRNDAEPASPATELDRWPEGRRNLVLLALGVGTGLAGYAASYLPPIYSQTSYWTSSPTFFFVRLGTVLALVAVAFAWCGGIPWRRTAGSSPIREFGVASLFVYWIHVEMVYGVLSTPLHRSLTFEQVLAAMALFSGFLFGLVRLKNRIRNAPGRGAKSAKFGWFRAQPASNGPQSG